MRTYVIVNGVPSFSIRGLVVCSLPPIRKPQMRTETEAIDGRDGETVTPLGYEAYEKSFDIGLVDDYDVDKTISYFAGSGVITFSNESDKLYRFTQVAEIDFERLVRWRKATVKVLVQPYKYSRLQRVKTYVPDGDSPIELRNCGNALARPTVAVTAVGEVGVWLDGKRIIRIGFGSQLSTIRIDSESMEATAEDGTLANRKVIGDPAGLALKPGTSELAFTGAVTKVTVEDYSRWI